MLSRILLRLALGLVIAVASAQATITNFVRPDFQNLSGLGIVSGRDPNPGLIHIQGLIVPTESSAAPTDGNARLTEVSFGQPFAPFVFRGISATYAAQVVAQVRPVLYPPRGATRAEVLSSGTAFRYKYLLFSPIPGEVDVTTHFQNMGDWFGEPERALVDAQILILRDALAVSPLDTGLRDLLLDCYYDLAVAEMQFAKQHLASLAAKHLGVTLTSPFVIDDEIKIYETLVTVETKVLAKYSELLSTTVEGVDPADFDDREQPGKPMGLYIFLHEQPYRNSIASEYATDTGVEVIPDYDAATQKPTPRLPENRVLFSAYKDYVTLLQVMGQYTQHQAELARLRGMRQAPNDLVKARNAISKIQSETATDFLLLRGAINKEFLPGDASGVNAAINGVETALADITNVRSFINGTANVLGLDPNFLLLVQGANLPGGFNNESFDLLFSLLKGPNQPLSDALAKLADATTKYQTFRASVDRVVQELSDVDSTFQERFVQITGYKVDDVPGFDGRPKPNSGSELDQVEKSIVSLQTRNNTLKELTKSLEKDLAAANATLNTATNLDGKVDTALQTYIATTKPAYEDIIITSAVAAATQVTFDSASGIAGAGTFVGGIVVGLAGVANGAAQVAASTIGNLRTRDIDYASVGFESELQHADNALTVNQAAEEVGAIKREQYANILETTDNTLALTQAMAQRTALLGEVQRITANQEGDSATVRKSYYADPIHFVRSENALLLADAAFRNAQRWVFYTQRALEYKWQQKFARTETSAQGIRSFDSGSLFKMRNAAELDDLLTQLKGWNDDRLIQDSGNDHTSFISILNDVLAPNPNVLNLTPAKRADPGVRVDLKTGELVSQLELFRRGLTRSVDNNGNLNIDFNTTHLDTLQADFFVGPNYTTTTVAPGEWRDKIVYLKINIIATDGTPIPQNKAGALSYGGQTFFRTRIPPCSDRSVQLSAGTPDGITPTDIPGEFFTACFRYYASANYNNVFTSQDTQNQSITVAYTGASAKSPTGEEILGSTYQINSFNQRSVAATRWRLTLFAPPAGWDVSRLKDIEIIVRHHSSARLEPVCQ